MLYGASIEMKKRGTPMIGCGNIARANALYRDGSYREALALYEGTAADRPGWGCLLHANIALCRKRLDLPIKLSVVVPIFNTGQYLEECLLSILNQTEASLEVIVINDGSSDNSLDIIQRTMKQDKRIVLINNNKPSGNPGTPRNQGIAVAKGKYLGFVDSDDWIEPDFFRSLLKVAEKGDLDLVFAAGYRNFLNNEFRDVRYNSSHFNDKGSSFNRYHESFMIWDKIYRTSVIKSLDIRLGETKAAVDVPFIFKAYYFLEKAGFSSEQLGYNYRRESATSVTVNFRKSSNCDFEIQAYKGVEDWSKEIGVSAQYRELIQFRKVNSYVYTLSVISLDEFVGFFGKIKPEVKAISRDLIARMSQTLKKAHVLVKYDAITKGDAASYIKAFRCEELKPAQSYTNKPQSGSPTFEIIGAEKGILFFPDWSRTNPYQKLFYASLAQNFNIRVRGYKPERFTKAVLEENKDQFAYIHLCWLHALMDTSRDDGANQLLDLLAHAQKLGYKIIYTAHNINSHDNEHSERELRFRKKIADYYDYALVHGQFAKQRLMDEIGVDEQKILNMPHGTYQGYYQNHVTRESARAKLGLGEDKFVFLFFGNIRGYKGVDALMDAYQTIRADQEDVALVIAGRVFDEESKEKIRAHVERDASILFRPGFIEDDDAQYYFNSADLVVLPYRRILTSGALLLSFAFNKPIIAPRSGLIPEFVKEGKHGYLFEDYDAMQILMRRAVHEQKVNPRAWAKQFDFLDLNATLRWPLITSQPGFVKIFQRKPLTEDWISKRGQYRYALIRILGNDLPGRHQQDQTLVNLEFTLKNENDFDDCLKLWVLNRIEDEDKKQKLVDLLNSNGKQFVDIPYDATELIAAPFCFEDLPCDDFKLKSEFDAMSERDKLVVDCAIFKHKNNYIINNNGARNFAIEVGCRLADWVFPWDGNCFLTEQAWTSLTATLQQRADIQYHIVPMERLLDNQDVLRPDHIPQPIEEPQIILRNDATLRFDESLPYGLRPKVDMLKKLSVPGIWDKSNRSYPWNYRVVQHGSHSFNYAWAGWVSRLYSGGGVQENSADVRAIAREKAIVRFIKGHDMRQRFRSFSRESLTFYDEHVMNRLRAGEAGEVKGEWNKTLAELDSRAQEYLPKPVYSVVDKTTLPPSGNNRDYWHPAPYAWPNPATADGLPYIFKDGERVPGTRMYEPESVKYDRTSIQRMFDETTTLALAGYVFSNEAYSEKAVRLIRAWFIKEKTGMNPHLTYSQVVMGKNESRGTASGLIETKDMYFFLDAVRLVRKSNFWRKDDEQKMLEWCNSFLAWLNTSDQGRQEVAATNNHGVAFDLQTYALAAFIGDVEQMYEILLRALSRMKGHVDQNGMQPHEMKRTTTAHYTAFNLHLWFNLNVLLRRTAGFNLFNEERDYKGAKFSTLEKATSWVLDRAAGDWPFKQIDKFDKDRYQHIYHTASRYSPAIKENYQDVIKIFSESKVVFFPHDGIAPFWTLQV